MDANGWPLADGMNVVWEGKGGPEMEGTYLLQFQGKSTVGAWPAGTWQVGSTNYGPGTARGRRLRCGDEHDDGATHHQHSG